MQAKRPTSSNILKVLLSEPIKRSWMSSPTASSASVKMKDSPPMVTIGSDGLTDESSVDEEVQEVLSSDDDYAKDWR